MLEVLIHTEFRHLFFLEMTPQKQYIGLPYVRVSVLLYFAHISQSHLFIVGAVHDIFPINPQIHPTLNFRNILLVFMN